jgi:hypothetical protein
VAIIFPFWVRSKDGHVLRRVYAPHVWYSTRSPRRELDWFCEGFGMSLWNSGDGETAGEVHTLKNKLNVQGMARESKLFLFFFVAEYGL